MMMLPKTVVSPEQASSRSVHLMTRPSMLSLKNLAYALPGFQMNEFSWFLCLGPLSEG